MRYVDSSDLGRCGPDKCSQFGIFFSYSILVSSEIDHWSIRTLTTCHFELFSLVNSGLQNYYQ